ncbi:MAG: DUF1361 domain-containing protein [Gloeobacterales cyanobacterium]
MKSQLLNWLSSVLEALYKNLDWMAWNLFLALIPLGLSVWLFRRTRPHTVLWWIGALIFLAFLPNAPYILTDVIHLIEDVRRYSSAYLITLVVLPSYLFFFFVGFEAYVFSLINLGHYLSSQGWKRWILMTEFIVHGLSALGIYLGRFQRFNSWDLVTQPHNLASDLLRDLAMKRPLVVIAVTFVVIASLYFPMKWISLSFLRQRLFRTFRQSKLS